MPARWRGTNVVGWALMQARERLRAEDAAADAVSGFNHVKNTPEARLVLAIVSASGTWLPEALVFGPANGPEDFQYVVYRAFGEAESPEGARRLLKDWNIYIDDFIVATHPCASPRGVTRGERATQGLTKMASACEDADGPSVGAAELLEPFC